MAAADSVPSDSDSWHFAAQAHNTYMITSEEGTCGLTAEPLRRGWPSAAIKPLYVRTVLTSSSSFGALVMIKHLRRVTGRASPPGCMRRQNFRWPGASTVLDGSPRPQCRDSRPGAAPGSSSPTRTSLRDRGRLRGAPARFRSPRRGLGCLLSPARREAGWREPYGHAGWQSRTRLRSRRRMSGAAGPSRCLRRQLPRPPGNTASARVRSTRWNKFARQSWEHGQGNWSSQRLTESSGANTHAAAEFLLVRVCSCHQQHGHQMAVTPSGQYV